MSDEEEYEVESIVSKRIKKGKVKTNIRILVDSKVILFVTIFQKQCSGSVSVWASRIRIRKSEVWNRIWILLSSSKIIKKKPWFLSFLPPCYFFMTFYL